MRVDGPHAADTAAATNAASHRDPGRMAKSRSSLRHREKVDSRKRGFSMPILTRVEADQGPSRSRSADGTRINRDALRPPDP